ncbi:MAG: hypothetical protein PWP31_1569 [Clostridia bacterium]|nr:hypothetical protein [Clostridia bacterium]
MHIAHLHWAFHPIIGGVESHLAMLGPEIVKNNYNVSLLTGSVHGTKEEEFYEGMYIKRTPFMDLNSLSSKKIIEQKNEIKQEIENFIDLIKPDLIHVHNMHYYSYIHADILYEIKQSRGVPLVLTAHNVWPDEDKMWQKMNERAHIWDAIIAVSGYIKRQLIRVGYDHKKIFVVHHGIDLDRFNPVTDKDFEEINLKYPQFKGRRLIFHPARMSADKGSHVSIKALNLIKEKFPDVLFILAGTGNTVDWSSEQQKYIDKIKKMIDKMNLGNNVFIQFFSWFEMPLIYKAVEFCIYPSCFEEPFGLALLESMASEKPIVVSQAGGMPEIVKDGENGFLVEMENEKELQDRCCWLLENKEMCQQIGKKGRSMVEEFWTKEVMTKAVLTIYNNLKLGSKN